MLIKSKTILITAAHPDDAEIGMSMRIIRHIQNQDRVYLLMASNGEHEDCPQGRKIEAQKAAKTLGVREYQFSEFPCGQLNNYRNELRNKIEILIKTIEPDLIYSIFPNDLHVDHRVVGEETFSAARSVLSLIFFRVAYSRQFNPNFFFFGTTTLMEKKLETLKCYKDEAERKGSLNPEVIKGLSQYEAHRYFHHKALSRLQKELQVTKEKPIYFESFLVERVTTV